MPLMDGDSKDVIAANVAELRRQGYKEDQAVQIAYRHAGKYKTPTPAKPKPAAPPKDDHDGDEGMMARMKKTMRSMNPFAAVGDKIDEATKQ